MTRQHRDARREAQGRSRTRVAPETFYPRPKVNTPANVVDLLRRAWGKREHLSAREREVTWSFLQQARSGALTDKQIAYAKEIGKSVGVGFDDPPVNDRASVQPWGPLPGRPPGR